ncbi:hypothetical protein [Geobacter sp. SVR]|uniref:hypothetical protein n=1 Tax=Geobacter sp. SVR TaxID=2495594 RepID=UPI00143F0147|nr:hypothetical protein [Geobacter sp. SVR]BCS52631.1 hypothetical protein GSVR_09390 [Geobacter sp. SVR]GCF83932.1 hypothetical protein GSbR_05320 [Geobacter sp. SVR]
MNIVKSLTTCFLALMASSAFASPQMVVDVPQYKLYVDPAKFRTLGDGDGIVDFISKVIPTKRGIKEIYDGMKDLAVHEQNWRIHCDDGTALLFTQFLYNAKGKILQKIPPADTRDYRYNYQQGTTIDATYHWVCDQVGYTQKTGHPVFYLRKAPPKSVLDIGN